MHIHQNGSKIGFILSCSAGLIMFRNITPEVTITDHPAICKLKTNTEHCKYPKSI